MARQRRENRDGLCRAGLLLLLALGGCAGWQPAFAPGEDPATGHVAGSASTTGPAPEAARHMVFAVMLLEYRYDEVALIEQLWRETDQQSIAASERQVLDRNGFRAGLLASQIPPSLGELLDTELPIVADVLPDLVEAHDDPDLPGRSRLTGMRMTFQPDTAREIPVSGRFDVASWQVNTDEQVSPGTATAARACFQLTASLAGEDVVSLAVLPGFREAGARPVFGSGPRDFELLAEQVLHPLGELAFVLPVRCGQTLLIGPTSQSSEIGRLFFGDPEKELYSDAYLRRLLLIRLIDIPD
jgi:hypothetical protein